MKELSIEAKAKAYDEAVINGSRLWECGEITRENYEYIFPELKESEDEKIRKVIKKALQVRCDGSRIISDEPVTLENAIAWLEKKCQKTQQTPQWMIDFLNENRGKFASLMGDYDEQRDAEGKLLAIIDWLEKQYKESNEKEFTFKALPRLLEMIEGSGRTKAYTEKLAVTLDNEGYHTDAKIIRESIKMMNGEEVPMATMDEYERIRKEIIFYLRYQYSISENFEDIGKWIAWLEKKSEKVDVIENFDTEFNKQVSRLLASAINREHEYNQGYVKWAANALLNYAKHELEKQGKQNITWSEEDESNFQTVDSVLFYDKNLPEDTCMRLRNWLKSLRPQNRWKPSDEQMSAVNTAIKVLGKGTLNGKQLIELQEQLKRLKRE